MRVENGYVFETGADVFQNDVQAIYRQIFGDDTNLAPGTQLGDQVQALVLAFTYLDKRMQGLNMVGKIDTAFGSGLSAMVKTRLNTDRFPASRATATVRFTGTANSLIPNDSQVSDGGTGIFLTQGVFAVGSAGTVDVPVVAQTAGYRDMSPGTITSIVGTIPGVSAVSQPDVGNPGSDRESDASLKQRYDLTLSRNAIADLDAFESAVYGVPGVRDVWVTHNPTLSPYSTMGGRGFGVRVDPKSVMVVVDGGDDNAIADNLYRVRVDGGATFSGNTVVRVVDPIKGLSTVFQDVKFQRPRPIPVQVFMAIEVVDTTAFTGNVLTEDQVVDAMKQSVASYIHNQKIGQPLREARLSSTLYSQFQGFDLDGNITIERATGAPGTGPVSNADNLQWSDMIVMGQDDNGNHLIDIAVA